MGRITGSGAKRLRRDFHWHLTRRLMDCPESLENAATARGAVGAAALEALVGFFDAAALRDLGLRRTGELLADWVSEQHRKFPDVWVEVPDELVRRVLADSAAQDEILRFVEANRLLRSEVAAVLRDSPRQLAEQLRVAREEWEAAAQRDLVALRDMAARVLGTVREMIRDARENDG
jgi:hypothetical protein